MGTKEVEVAANRIATLEAGLEGMTAVLTDRVSERSIESIEGKQQKKPTPGQAPRDPEQEFRDSLYVIDEGAGRYGLPGIAFKKALVSAARFTDDHKMVTLRGAVHVIPDAGDLVEIHGPPPTMRTDLVRLNGKTGSVAYRGSFQPWSVTLRLVFNSDVLTAGQLLTLIELAGQGVGVGAWRLEKGGPFGMFRIKEGSVRLG